MGDTLGYADRSLSTAAGAVACVAAAAVSLRLCGAAAAAAAASSPVEGRVTQAAPNAAQRAEGGASKRLTPAGVAWANAAAAAMPAAATGGRAAASPSVGAAAAPAPQQDAPPAEKRRHPPPPMVYDEGGAVQTIVVIGLSMVGWKFCEELVEKDHAKRYRIVSFCEEAELAYNRLGLSKLFNTFEPEKLEMTVESWYAEHGIEVHVGQRAAQIDRANKQVLGEDGRAVAYDYLVLATGSYAWIPPVPGTSQKRVFVYRTIQDCRQIIEASRDSKSAAVIGGGLLGLEAVKACYDMKVPLVHAIDTNSGLMSRQLDLEGGTLLKDKIEALAEGTEQEIKVHLNARTKEVLGDDGTVSGLKFSDGRSLACDLLVICTGIRPRDELAKECGIEVGKYGGIVVDDGLRTSDDSIFAIGEVACHKGMCYGLVAPGNAMATAVAAQMCGESEGTEFHAGSMDAKLKLMGIDVASFGVYKGGPGWDETLPFAYSDPFKGTYKKLLFSKDGKKLMGGMLVGDASDYAKLARLCKSGKEISGDPDELVRGKAASGGDEDEELTDDAQICSCNNVDLGTIKKAIADGKLNSVPGVMGATKAGKGCGGCIPAVTDILKQEMLKAGATVTNYLCPHFDFSRAELCQIIKVKKLKTFDDILADCGNGGLGCEVCKPVLHNALASLWNEPVTKKQHRPLLDSNDRFLANTQRGASYSVIPRIPGGEILPQQLVALGVVAEKFGLYTKISGAQRVVLFGAAVHQLPDIWKDLIDAGFESGHAYAKALRAVKSCVGSTWCRYGIGDSVGFAIKVEERYRGIRSPHKFKGGVSGCTRECAEAQGKDFGMIAVKNGYNLYVCGNGGAKPRHADLLAESVSEEYCIQLLDRFLMYYILTADKLQRTSVWMDKLEGGLQHLKDVVIHDKLGLCAELEERMSFLVNTYECEWKATIEDPEKVKSFRQFVNTDKTERGIEFIEQRGQQRPADWPEAAKSRPWKAERVDIALEDNQSPPASQAGSPPTSPSRTRPAQIAVENENGQQVFSTVLTWVDMGAAEDFVPNGGAAVLYGKSQLAVYQFPGGAWYACQNFSPKNRTFAMSRGIIGDKKGTPSVADPVHKTTFALTTGQCISEPGEYSVLTFSAKEEAGRVLLELPPTDELDEILATAKNEIKYEEASIEKSDAAKVEDQSFKEKGSAFAEQLKPPPAADGCGCGAGGAATDW